MIGDTVSHYRVIEKIGGGGMGVVYKAEDVRLGRVVALKFLNPALIANESNRKRFLREAQAASLIDHPNVCHVYQVEETDDGRLFIAMAYYGGRSLRAAIEEGALPARQAFEIAFSVAQGLWAAHRRGIVHRDIKPGNIVVSDDGFVKIVDFGLALLMGQSRVTTGDARVGTVAYMSPEQASSSSVDERTDIWSLGVVMYEMMTGQLPFRGDVDAATLYAIRSEPHTPLREAKPDVPEACAAVVERCLAKNPDDRYPNVEALLADMVRAANACGWGDTVASRTIAPILAAKKRRAWARRAAVATVMLAVAAGGWWLWSRRGPPSPYTTDLRVAVLPFQNHLGPEYDRLVLGLSDESARALDAMHVLRGSMWTVPFASVVTSDLPDPSAAAGAFGVNRIVTGDVERYGDQQRMTIALRDRNGKRIIRREFLRVDRDAANTVLRDLDVALARLIGVETERLPATLATANGPAALAYLNGIGRLAEASDSTTVMDAVAWLDSCATTDPTFVAGANAAGNAHVKAFKRTRSAFHLQRAQEYARRVRALAPDFVGGALLAGDGYWAAGETDSAIGSFRSALEIEPGNYLASRALATLYASESRISEAEDVYRAFVSARPDFWAGHRELGYFYFEQGRTDDAEVEWETARTLAPHDVWTLSSLGAIHFVRDEWAAARECFAEAFRIHPSCDPCNNIATSLYFDGKFEESVRYFDLAVQYCDTNDCKTWGNLASALYWAPGGRERSRSVYRHAIRKANESLQSNPGDPLLTALLVDYYSMSGDSVDTKIAIANASELLKKDAQVMYSVGSAYEKMGQRELALYHLGNAVRHGFSLQVIRGAPLLDDIEHDPRFQEMMRNQSPAEGATAAHP